MRAGGIPLYRQEEDRSAVFNISDNDYECIENQDTSLINPENTFVLFACIYGLSATLVFLSTYAFMHKVIIWLQQQGNHTKLICNASGIVLTLVNVITFISDIYFWVRYGETFMIYTNLPWKILLVIFEPSAVCCGPCMSTTCIVNRNNIVSVFALWQIICFVHRLVNDTIISVAYFIIAPAQTLGVVTLLLSVIAGAIIFVAFVIKGYDGRKTSCELMFFTITIGFIITALLTIITLVFITFVDNGLKSAGMGGLILSLIPLLVAFEVGYLVKKKNIISTFLGGEATVTENTSTNSDLADQESQSERQPLLASPRGRHT